MGMFDWVAFAMTCPVCGREVAGFQTKDGDYYKLDLDWREVEELTNFYSYCEHGKSRTKDDDYSWKDALWIEFERECKHEDWRWETHLMNERRTKPAEPVDIWSLPGAKRYYPTEGAAP